MPAPIPTPQQRDALAKALHDLIEAIESHWVPPKPHPTLYYVWDFIKRSKYWLSEYDNIKDGKPLLYPEQFTPAPAGKGEPAAVSVFNDVCNRTMMTRIIVQDKSGKLALMTGAPGGQPVDFGDKCREACERLMDATPDENMLAS